jgi:serine/threonine-protein kinase
MNQDFAEQIARRLCSASDWHELSYIDGGNSGSVFRIIHPEHGPVALKIYDPAFFRGENALIEAKRIRLQDGLRAHGNPFLIEILEVGEVPADATWFLLMELCPWPNLEKSLGSVREDQVEELCKQLVEGVLFLQGRGLVHRDIKPANIVVDLNATRLKLLDLGVLRLIEHTEGNGTDQSETKRFVATAQYSSPEYLTREELPGARGFEAINIYQVGAVLHDLIMKVPIFKEEAETQNKYILYKAVTAKTPLVVNPNLPPRLISLCKAALFKDPVVRLEAVSLAQLASKSETTKEIRKRLTANRSTIVSRSAPSTLIWKRPVRDWLREAALQEKETLGPHKLREIECDAGIAWELSFSSAGRSLTVVLTPSADKSHLVLTLSASVPEQFTTPVLEIFDDGTQIDDSEVITQLSTSILYMLDLSSSASAR